jgi:hypothetical protein
VTFPLEEPVRVVEDAAVDEMIDDGCLDVDSDSAARRQLLPASGAIAPIGRPFLIGMR